MIISFDKIEHCRKLKRIRISDICKNLGIGATTYWRWKKGNTEITEANLQLLATALNVPTNQISDLEDKRVSDSDLKKKMNSCLEFKSKGRVDATDKINNVIDQMQKVGESIQNTKLIINGLFEAMNFAFYIKDKSLRYVFANRKFLEMLLLEPYHIVSNQTDENFFSYKEARFNNEQDKQVLFSGKSVEGEEIPFPGTRKKINALAYKFPIMDENNKVAGIVGVFIESPMLIPDTADKSQEISITPINTPEIFKYY